MQRLLLTVLVTAILYSSFSASFAQDTKTAANGFRTLPGFEVDLLYKVPGEKQGSWVAMCVDPKGRLLTSDQYGKLYRVTLDANGANPQVEALKIDIGEAQGMLYAYDSLYININGKGPTGPGVYRIKDTDNDDQFDQYEHIVPMKGGAGEHGPHALVLGPDKKIYFCSGNQTDFPDKAKTGAVPRHWSEDHPVGRMPDGRGFMKDRLAPGGWLCRMDENGDNVELMVTGFRNEYDIAFNPQGELFTYDADMEWDIGTPWYRPTRINHCISGAEFGWRNGTGKWPDYYGDSFGSVVNIGPGSPTGITFGTAAKFPAKYQNALFISDWSYGVIYAVHLTPDGSSYTGTFESFATAAPMAVTDLVIHPNGSMYFMVGGRRTGSALYRLSYKGTESTATATGQDNPAAAEARKLRHRLEAYHVKPSAEAIPLAVDQLGSPDRAIRFAARIALEHLPVEQWREAVLKVTEPRAIVTATYALARTGSKQDQGKLIEKLSKIEFAKLPPAGQLELIRAYELIFLRLAPASDSERATILAQVDSKFPGKEALVNRELANLLVMLKAPKIVDRCVGQLRLASAQEDQIHYAFCIREVKDGWTDQTRKGYFQWFFDVATARGGASFGGFLANIRTVAMQNLTAGQKEALGELAGELPTPKDPLADYKPRSLVKEWKVAEIETELAKVTGKRDFERGRQLCAVAQCFKCHRFSGQGGIQGPDLTASSGRFSPHDMLVAIIEPNKEISDQYQATQFVTENGIVVGRVANLNGNKIMVVTNMLDPGDFKEVDVDMIIERRPAPTSMMPSGLLDTFKPDEIADLLAYLRSGGNATHPVYQQ
jgi:putative heme-binding domain-containing protein